MKYDLVFLDADDTLFDFGAAEANAFGRALSDFKLAHDSSVFSLYQEINHALWQDLEKGLVNQETLRVERFRRLFDAIGGNINPVDFALSFTNWLGKGTFLLPGAEELCRNLAGKIIQVILTNGIQDVQDYIPYATYQFIQPLNSYVFTNMTTLEDSIYKDAQREYTVFAKNY